MKVESTFFDIIQEMCSYSSTIRTKSAVKYFRSLNEALVVYKNKINGILHLGTNTVMILSFRTPKTFVVITLKFELCGFTID